MGVASAKQGVRHRRACPRPRSGAAALRATPILRSLPRIQTRRTGESGDPRPRLRPRRWRVGQVPHPQARSVHASHSEHLLRRSLVERPPDRRANILPVIPFIGSVPFYLWGREAPAHASGCLHSAVWDGEIGVVRVWPAVGVAIHEGVCRRVVRAVPW
jgi:hypothetical protein